MLNRLNPVRSKTPKASVLSPKCQGTSNRVNKACKFFPCHNALQDCTFCYCPFYPCLNKSFGKFVYSRKLKGDVWSCEDCDWIHKKQVVEQIFSLLRENKFKLAGKTPFLGRDKK